MCFWEYKISWYELKHPVQCLEKNKCSINVPLKKGGKSDKHNFIMSTIYFMMYSFEILIVMHVDMCECVYTYIHTHVYGMYIHMWYTYIYLFVFCFTQHYFIYTLPYQHKSIYFSCNFWSFSLNCFLKVWDFFSKVANNTDKHL